jgi:hypothetical protein
MINRGIHDNLLKYKSYPMESHSVLGVFEKSVHELLNIYLSMSLGSQSHHE